MVKKKTLGNNNFNLLSNNSAVTTSGNGTSTLSMNSTNGRSFGYKKNSWISKLIIIHYNETF